MDSEPDDFVADFGDAPTSDVNPPSFQAAGQQVSLGDGASMVAGLGDSESLPGTAMLVRFVPPDLPAGAIEPVVGLFAVIEMVLGAFVSSFKQLGGPVTAAALYLVYSVVHYLRAKRHTITE